MWKRECITATSGARRRTCISGVSRVLDRNGPVAPCRRRIRSKIWARVVVHAPLTVTNWASSVTDSTMPSASCLPHASLKRNSISRIASSSDLVIITPSVAPKLCHLAHVAERHRFAGWLLLFGHGVVLSMKEKAQRWAGLVKGCRPRGPVTSAPKDQQANHAPVAYRRD